MAKKKAKSSRLKKTFFEPVDLNVNFPEMEKALLIKWYKKGVHKKYLTRNKKSKKYFSFLDGPITANNPMGVHHAWGRTYKDLWPRFYNMRGYRQRFQNGFDCQGLWVEVEVEKELGFKTKKDIEQFGVAKFVDLCKARVKKYSQIQTEQSKRLGYFADWDHSYYTLSDDNNYMIWHFLKVCHEAGWLYKGNDSVPWCPRCETAISQHEMLTEDYKEITHESVYLAFPIVGRNDEYLMVWTTTPWTVPANISIAVDNNLVYSLVEIDDSIKKINRKYWLAKDTLPRVLKDITHKVLKEERGEKLVGLKYHAAFDDLPAVSEVYKKAESKFHTVIATDNLILPVTTSEGTGLVHTAVSAGVEDFKLGKKLELPMIPVIHDDASYLDGFGFLSGKNAKKHPELILDYLRKLDSSGRHFFFKVENYKHRYPACWRCKTELVWKVTDEWYIAMDKKPVAVGKDTKVGGDTVSSKTLRERMIAVAQKISWLPAFGLEREVDWLNNMHDWLISKKNRYWGLALPIWECAKCGNFEVIGSKSELQKKATSGWQEFEGKSPHKPQVDAIKINCSKCGNLVSRIEAVGNPWLDAGIVPFSTISDDNKASNFEYTKTTPLYLKDRTKWLNWYPVNFITESFPGQFKNWFYSLIAMSTVLEDRNPFKTVLGYGTLLGEDGRPMHKSWGNSIEFNEAADKIGADVMRLMFVKQNPAENMLFGYKLADEVRRRFYLKLWNTYNYFVSYANLDYFRPIAPTKLLTGTSEMSVLDRWILIRLNQVVDKVTLAFERFDPQAVYVEYETFLEDLSNWYIRRSRDRTGFSSSDKKDKKDFYNTALSCLVNFAKIIAPVAPFLADTLYTNLTKENSVHLANWPVALQVNKKDFALLSEMASARLIVEEIHKARKFSQIAVRQPLSSVEVTCPGYEKIRHEVIALIASEVNIKKVNIKAGKSLNVGLDTTITADLKEEAQTRELIRSIQEARKELGVGLQEFVDVASPWLPKNKELLSKLTKQTLTKNLVEGKFTVKSAS